MKNIYIDESGVSNINIHSTFAFVVIEVTNKDVIEKQIQEIESSLRIKNSHWRDMSWSLREKFSERLKSLDFEAHVVIHKNPINMRQAFLESVEHAVIKSDYTSMIIDGSKDQKMIKIIRQFLRSKNKSITTIKQKHDETEPILRIADFVAGSSRAYYDNPEKDTAKKIFEILKSKLTFTTIKF